LSSDTTLLFLHGVGNGDHDDRWKAQLDETLEALGYPGLDSVHVVAPKYAHALKGWDDKQSVPPITIKQPSREAAKQNRRDFESRMGAIEFRLGRHDQGNGTHVVDAAVSAAVGLPNFVQARKYLTDPQVRAQVLNRILGQVRSSGRLVLVGHSLGSVIAADLINRLPVGTKVVGMITIGSPLANGAFTVDKLRDTLKQPPTNLDWWVNFWNVLDPVAAHRGVSSAFPWIIDFRINTKAPSLKVAHYAESYLSNRAVGAAIGFALFGSRSRELARLDEGVDIPLDPVEQMAVLALRYAHLLKAELVGDQRERFGGALRQVQAAVVDSVRNRNDSERRGLPSTIARLAFDLSDVNAAVPEPLPSRHLDKEEAAVLLTLLAAENVIRPFDITVSRDKRLEAMKNLSAEMGLTSQYGAHVFEAAKRAQDALSGGRTVNWVKLGALGAGAAAIVVATGGLALAAGAGLAGAAVVTSALASFGPGGMIGGLLTAGTLVTAGGGGIASGLASPGTSAEALEAVVERRLATEILRQLQGLEPDPSIWRVFVEIEMSVRREYERLDEFSDESSPLLKELKQKIESVERALKHLRDIGLEPGVQFASTAPRS
jgi:pimeloyl-ACP methyl ester carboxylesterase